MVLGWGWRWGGYVHVLVLRDNARGSVLPRSRSEGNSTARRPLSTRLPEVCPWPAPSGRGVCWAMVAVVGAVLASFSTTVRYFTISPLSAQAKAGASLSPSGTGDAQALAVGRDTLAGCAPFLLERQPRSGRWAVAMPHGDSTRVFHPTVPRRVRMKTEAGVAYLLRSVVPKKRVTQHADGCIPPSIRKRQSGEMRTVNGRLAALRAPHGGPSAQLPCGARSAASRPLIVQ